MNGRRPPKLHGRHSSSICCSTASHSCPFLISYPSTSELTVTSTPIEFSAPLYELRNAIVPLVPGSMPRRSSRRRSSRNNDSAAIQPRELCPPRLISAHSSRSHFSSFFVICRH